MGTSLTSTKVVVSAAGEATASEAKVVAPHDGVESGYGIDEGQLDASLATNAMDVDTTGQV